MEYRLTHASLPSPLPLPRPLPYVVPSNTQTHIDIDIHAPVVPGHPCPPPALGSSHHPSSYVLRTFCSRYVFRIFIYLRSKPLSRSLQPPFAPFLLPVWNPSPRSARGGICCRLSDIILYYVLYCIVHATKLSFRHLDAVPRQRRGAWSYSAFELLQPLSLITHPPPDQVTPTFPLEVGSCLGRAHHHQSSGLISST